jgi:trehalose/maltose transport system substrate-binding protein
MNREKTAMTKHLAALGASLALALLSGSALGATIHVASGSTGGDLEAWRETIALYEKQSGNKVELVPAPQNSTEQLALYQQMLAAGAADIDVFQIDIIWPGMLASHMVDLKDKFSKADLDKFFKPILAANTVNGKLVAIPYFTDAGLLYYRKDLLDKYHKPVPATWQEMAATAREIQDGERAAGNKDMWGFVWQGRASESLTCSALELIDSAGGGSIVDSSGKITINNPAAVKAVDLAASWINTISPPGTPTYGEEEARGVWQAGNAVFMRNWPYAFALGNGEDSPIKGKYDVRSIPPMEGPGGKESGTLGGWNLAVSKYSKNQDAAIDLVKFVTSVEMEKWLAMKYSKLPTVESLYKDPDIAKAQPFIPRLEATFRSAVARPSGITGDRYNQVSTEFFNAVHSVLVGDQKADEALSGLDKTLTRLSRGGRW